MSVVTIDEQMKKDTSFDDVAAGSRPPVGRRYRPRQLLRLGVIGLLLVVGAVALGHWLVNRWTHVYVVDSRIAADVITMSSEVEGRVTALAVVAGDRVAQGDLLVAIENRRARLELQRIDAEIARIEALQSELRAQQDMIRRQVASKLEAARAELAAGEADHRASEAELAQARSDYERVNSLFDRGVVASQRFEQVQMRFASAEQQELHAAAEIERARAALAITEAEEAQIAVLERKVATLDAEKMARVAHREQQLIDLDHCELRAPFDGVVDQSSTSASMSPRARAC
jgi:membrane fusion protein, multidrug efflux system